MWFKAVPNYSDMRNAVHFLFCIPISLLMVLRKLLALGTNISSGVRCVRLAFGFNDAP